MAPSNGKAKEKKANQGHRKPQTRERNFQDEKNVESAQLVSKEAHSSVVPTWLQQAVLDVFAKSFGPQDANELRQRIQSVKGSLYNREFIAAFESAENQEAYCLRWSPSRALAYTELLCTIPEIREFLKQSRVSSSDAVSGVESEPSTNITCVGGGAGAEAVAFAAALRYIAYSNDAKPNPKIESDATTTGLPEPPALQAIDIADWSSVLSKLQTGANDILSNLTIDAGSPPSTPTPSTPSTTFIAPSIQFKHTDILTLPPSELAQLLQRAQQSLGTAPAPAPATSQPTLVTILFTLNELYSTSLARTTSLLLALTTHSPRGTLLLVVDSPGSYSTVTLAGAEKRYPMQWLMDHTLLTQASKLDGSGSGGEQGSEPGTKTSAKAPETAKWEKLGSEESRWWRMDRQRLRYRVAGVELEDMRMQWHLFRRL